MNIDSIAALKSLLSGMERDLGLDDLSPSQLDIFYAVTLINEKEGPASPVRILEHDLSKRMSRATLFRCLKSLTRLGYLTFRDDGEGVGYLSRLP